MSHRLRSAIQHIHNRIRIDENWFITRTDQLISKQILAREREQFEKFKKSIESEYSAFLKDLNSRHMEQGSNPGEKIGSFVYVSSPEPPYTVTRFNGDKQEIVFSLNELQEYRKLSESAKNSVGIPILRISDKEDKIIAVVDLVSNDRPSLFVKDVARNKIIVRFMQDMVSLASSATWSKDGSFYYYTVPDKQNRPAEIKLRRFAKADQELTVLTEPDEAFYLELNETKDKKYSIFYSMSRTSSEVHYVDRIAAKPVRILPKRLGTRYYLEHNKGFFYVITNQNSAEFQLVRFPVNGSIKQCEVVLEGDFLIDELDMYENHIVVYTRSKGIPVIKIYDLKLNVVQDLKLPYKCKAFSIQPGSNLDYLSNEFTFIYSSPSVYEDTLIYNFESKTLRVSNRKRITGQPLRLDKLRSLRAFAPSFDGTLVPMTIVSHEDIQQDSKNRVLLKGYGAYGLKADQSFKYSESVAAQDGWVLVSAHVRGEGEQGLAWHQAATKENKFRSFNDLLACAFYLIKEGWTRKQYLAGYGCSAGGLLMAQAMNLNPELFAAMVLEVPFVDPLSEMLNPDLPLSVTDRDEWGDPLKSAQMFDEIRGYSPYDNLHHCKYPPLLITGSEIDSKVSFPNILKYIQRIRSKALKREGIELCKQNIALHTTEGGHFGQGDLESEAIIWGFLNKTITRPKV